MNISFQYANRRKGNTSLLLRFDGLVEGQTVCLLVDAGQDVDVDSLLDDDEYLTGIVLTHLHYDHYTALGDALRDGAQIYASEPTAALLDDVLSVAATHADGSVDRETILDHTVAVDGQTTIAGAIDLYPVPAGHAPGATAYYLRVEAGGETETLLLTGDCTLRRAGGYPGLPLCDVDGLVLNGATESAFEEELTESVAKTVELAAAGSSTLVTANGLTAVQFAYVLGHAIDDLDRQLPVTITGHAATLYDRLAYDVPHVRSVPTYEQTDEVLGPGEITISGPESPTEGSSGRLYGAIRDQPGAALVQLVGGDGKRVTDGSCTTVHYRLVNHPSEDVLDTIVEVTDPEQILMFHQGGKSLAEYREHFDRSVWAPNDSDSYRIYDAEQGWRTPPWVSEYTRQAMTGGGSTATVDAGMDALDTAVARESTPDLQAEGLDIEGLRTRFGSIGTPSYDSGDQSTEPVESETEDASQPLADPPQVSKDGATSTSASPADTSAPTPADGTAQPQSTDGGTASEDPTSSRSLEQRLDALERRLEALDTSAAGETIKATVVELGDGSVLLDPVDGLPDAVEHGETVWLDLAAENMPDE
jgi:putative mRNA 3-end processing factor